LLGKVLDRFLPDTPDQVPTDAGEQMLRDIALIRDALTKISRDSVLLIHMP
jgi:hypothetical protein